MQGGWRGGDKEGEKFLTDGYRRGVAQVAGDLSGGGCSSHSAGIRDQDSASLNRSPHLNSPASTRQRHAGSSSKTT
jgi:hypothetical protein